MIRIWHIAEIKPYVGSLSSWLSKQAGAYKDRFIGVYFDVRAYTLEDALERLKNGDRPDIISFPEGSLEASGFADVIAYSVPYCATGSFVVFDPVKAADTPVEKMAASAGSPEAFKKGKCFSCVCDIRGLGDLERAQLAGKCPYFEAESYPEAGFKYQSIGYFSGVSVEKIPYISGFIEHISNTAAQGSLCGIGLLPVNAGFDIGFEIEAIRKLYESFCETAIRETL
ncbi:MAG: hypothetical protein K6G56_02355 [Clostridiales bacterium]|nr:hypothetical protein [Clostridiales bacterium]